MTSRSLIEFPQKIDSPKQLGASWRGAKLKSIKKLRYVAPELRISRTEALEIIKIVRTRQCGSFLDAEPEGVPFEHCLNCLISVRTCLASRNQRPADLRVEIYFFVDRPAHLLERFQMFALRFFEMQADQSIVHLKDLICEHRHSVERNRHQRGIPPFRLQLTEMPHVHRCRLTSHLQKSVLVNFSSPVRRNANASQRTEAV